jgi:Porin subfamily
MMKMVKSILLGSAAGVVAVTAGQAADLPVKAKPVEYVKVCSLYGAGFFYIPGTDKCIKLGGYFREQWDIHGAGDAQAYMNSQARWTRGDTSDSSFRTRSLFSIDVREQSAYGTIRGYTAFGAQQTTGSDTLNSGLFFNRSFVQFAGFTGGRAVSFFDLISFDPYGLSNIRPNLGNTGASGINVFAYTWQLGNGAAFTISAEDSCAQYPTGIGLAAATPTNTGSAASGRGCTTVNASGGAVLGVGATTIATEGYNIPDIVASLRVDQAWGSAQVMGAYHRVGASYYYTTTTTAGDANNGHPGDKAGWAVGAGFILNNVLGMHGDQFGVQANYSQGAVGYLTNGTGGSVAFAGGANGFGNSVTWGHAVDAIYSSGVTGVAGCVAAGTAACGSGLELTSGWTVGGFYEHHWTPQWKTSIYGGYVKIMYDNNAAAFYCTGSTTTYVRGSTASTATGGFGSAMLAGSSCDPNTQFWSLGTRTMWNPNSNLDLGVDFMWNSLSSANSGAVTLTSQGSRPAGVYNINSNYGNYTTAIRAQYNFLP